MSQAKIVSIATAVVPGERRHFVNVYGLDTDSHVWQWNAKLAKWEPHKVPERRDDFGGGR
jgi:hypothetical protein